MAIWSDLKLWDANYAEAIALLHEALAIDPGSVMSLTNLGAALSDTGKHRRARRLGDRPAGRLRYTAPSDAA